MPRSRPPRPRAKTPPTEPSAAPTPAPSAADPPPTRQRRLTSQRDPDEGFVAVGRVLGPFGLKGELKVQSLTDNPKRFAPRSKLWLGSQPVTVTGSREAQGYVYLTLKGFPDRSAIEPFRHTIIQVPEAALPPLPEGEFYRFQLVGLAVFDGVGAALGIIEEVLETGANDVYRVRAKDGKELLIPALQDVVIAIDLDTKRMVVDPPDWR